MDPAVKHAYPLWARLISWIPTQQQQQNKKIKRSYEISVHLNTDTTSYQCSLMSILYCFPTDCLHHAPISFSVTLCRNGATQCWPYASNSWCRATDWQVSLLIIIGFYSVCFYLFELQSRRGKALLSTLTDLDRRRHRSHAKVGVIYVSCIRIMPI